jgi:2-dehydro-3-deoxygalactonokinase
MTGLPGLDWIAADWGTTNLRVWAMDRGGAVLARAESTDGMGGLERAGYEAALIRLVGAWLPQSQRVPVVVCGMAGSRQGWVEARYRSVPCAPLGEDGAGTPQILDPRLVVTIVPGLKQDRPADVMRGEETQIAGFLARNPGFDGVLCLPGTHSKWAVISAGEVVSFQTFMTGEMFALLSRHSVLRHSVVADGWDEAAFLDAVGSALSQPEKVAARLFSIRAEALLHGLRGETARSRLSGLLIGSELAGSRAHWLGREVVIIGASGLARGYRSALAAQGLSARVIDVEAMTLSGLAAARSALREAVR